MLVKKLPSRVLQFRHKTLDLSAPKVMGVLNVTPDSFSDGGRFNTLDGALAHCEQMLTYGVDIVDIGGESTRPNAPKVSTDEELSRVVPVVCALRRRFGDELWLSLDTSTPAVMQAGIEAGADMVNDVRALRRDGAAVMVAKLACPVVLMHSRGEPDTMDKLTTYQDVIADIKSELGADIARAVAAGICQDNIVIDVGMGFAKRHLHHVALMQRLDELIAHFELPMLFGVSRKRFLGEILSGSGLDYLQQNTPADRDVIGVMAHLLAIQQGASIVRVHDVKHMVQAIALYQALQG
ncbi:MAG: dihydropteroate synthase [Moraxella sp.]|nr:dihydropteroate synthase [Moraxella sp.]